MIQEIFITDLACNVLYGSPRLFPASADLERAGSGVWHGYPVETVGNRRLSRLRVNDVVLAILYTAIDNFTASRFLQDLKSLIERRISRIDSKSVRKNYFTLLELLQNVSSVFPNPIVHDTAASTRRENVYIDVVENIHTVIGEDGEVLKNCIHGEILSDGSDFKLLLEGNGAVFKTLFEKTPSGVEVSCGNDLRICFVVRNCPEVLFRMIRQEHVYTLESTFKGQFRHIEVAIPVGKSSYSTRILQSTGTSDFDMESGVVRWRISHQSFTKETIKVHAMALEEEADTRPIMVAFRIEDPQDTSVRIKGCKETGGSSRSFWARHIIQSGHYEFRQ